MKKIHILLTFLVIAIFITSCQAQQRLPAPPGAIQPGPLGEAGAAFPAWAADGTGFITIAPAIVSLAPGASQQISVSADDDYVWNKGYVLNSARTWLEIDFDCTPIEGTGWCTGSIGEHINVNLNSFFTGTNYVIAYTCTWDQAAQNFACSGNKWKIATFGIQQSATTIGVSAPLANATSIAAALAANLTAASP